MDYLQLPPPLSEQETNNLIRLYKENGDIGAKEKLISHNIRLVIHMAKPFRINYLPYIDDIIMCGNIGLVKGIDAFKINHNTKLVTFLSTVIRNDILMYIRGLSKHKNVSSYDELVSISDDNRMVPKMDLIADEKYMPGKDEDLVRMGIESEISKLSPREQEILELRYGLHGKSEHTQTEVAKMFDYSQSYVSRIEKKAIKKLQLKLL